MPGFAKIHMTRRLSLSMETPGSTSMLLEIGTYDIGIMGAL